MLASSLQALINLKLFQRLTLQMTARWHTQPGHVQETAQDFAQHLQKFTLAQSNKLHIAGALHSHYIIFIQPTVPGQYLEQSQPCPYKYRLSHTPSGNPSGSHAGATHTSYSLSGQ